MKRFLFSALIPFFCLQCFAQDSPLSKGQIRLSGGLGLISYIKIAGGTTTFPPITVSGEYAVTEDITVGAIAGYTATENTYPGFSRPTKYSISNTLIGVRANYYFSMPEKYEVYSGAMLGYNAVKISVSSQGSSYDEYALSEGVGGLLYGIHVGGRYKFTPFTSAFAEIGYGIAVLNIGLTIHLPGKN